MSNCVNFVVFGLGRAGHIHAGNILRNTRANLKYLIEEDCAKAQTYLDENNCTAKVLPAAKASEALSDPLVHAAIVCTPTPSHEECVLMSLKAGKAVFCEKPIAHSTEGTAACFDEAERHGLPLFCAFNRRFDPGTRSIIQATQQGKLGRVHMIKQSSRDSPLPSIEYLKISNGIFHDCGVHDIDVISTIVGEAPSVVYAQAHSFVPSIQAIGDVDSVAITMKFPCGAIAQIDMDRSAIYGYDQRLEVFGDKGMFRSENMKPTAVTFASQEGVLHDVNLFSFPQRYAESYVNELNHFIDITLGKADCEVKRDQVMLACKVASACEQSYRKGMPVHFEN